MRIASIFIIIIFFSCNVNAQSQKAKEKFINEVFNDFKKNRLEKISERFVDSVFLDELITKSLKRKETVTKNNSREKIHEQRVLMKERFSNSLDQAYLKYTTKKTKGLLKKVNPLSEIYKEREEPIKTFGIKYEFNIGEFKAEMKIDKIVYDEKRKRFAIMSRRVRSYLGAGELWIAKTNAVERDYKVGREEDDVVPPPVPDLRRKPIPIGSEGPQEPPKEDIQQFVEQMPEYPGGQEAMMKFIQKNIEYPAMARESKIAGKVYTQFVVGKDGAIRNIKVIKGIGSGCDQEAIRVIKRMPKWKPGRQRGKVVPVKFVLPFSFKLK